MPDSQERNRDLGQKIRSLRLRRFWTQEQLAEASGVGRVTVARLEAGSGTPRLRTVRALADALDVEPQELVPDADAFWGR